MFDEKQKHFFLAWSEQFISYRVLLRFKWIDENLFFHFLLLRERVKVLIIKTDIKFDPWVFRCLFLCTEVFSALRSVPTGHLLQFLNLSGSPLVCHPGAVKPSLYSLNHCLCQLTSCGKESSSNRQMKGHHHCPDANCFYQPTKCGCLAVTTGFSQQVCFPVVLIF